MIEVRAHILDIPTTQKKLEGIGATFDSDYAFKDVIFIPKKDRYNLDDDFLRMRIYTKNNWFVKNVVVARKQTQFTKSSKTNIVSLKKEFETPEEAFDFIKKQFSLEFTYGFEFEREGWQYNFKDCRVFIEDIKGYGPSVEVEGESEQEIKSLLNQIKATEVMRSSVPEIMRKILNKI